MVSRRASTVSSVIGAIKSYREMGKGLTKAGKNRTKAGGSD